jgi:5-carboxymethyl-2-hydroxymuconate isomerase
VNEYTVIIKYFIITINLFNYFYNFKISLNQLIVKFLKKRRFMPHVRIEYSNELEPKIDRKSLFSFIHQTLHETIEAEIPRCQSRILQVKDSYVGDGSEENLFFHVEIKIIKGRLPEQKKALADRLLHFLEKLLRNDSSSTRINIHLVELDMESYFLI